MIGNGNVRGAMRFFNAGGPGNPARHSAIDPLSRIDPSDVLALVDRWQYFSVHAPRQSGKTTALLALQDLLNSGSQGSYRCVHVDVEAAQALRENLGEALRTILSALARRARTALGDTSIQIDLRRVLDSVGPGDALAEVLSRWAVADHRPLVLLIDEIDALVADTLLAVLR